MGKAWYVNYATDAWSHCEIIIHCETKAEVRNILKKHLNGVRFVINRITEWSVENEQKKD